VNTGREKHEVSAKADINAGCTDLISGMERVKNALKTTLSLVFLSRRHKMDV
jgi:hypothetical protein